MPDLSRPSFRHLQNGAENPDLRELLWGKMKRRAYSALSWGLGWDCIRGPLTSLTLTVNTSIVAGAATLAQTPALLKEMFSRRAQA